MIKCENLKYQTADDFFEDLGYHTEDNRGRHWEHPIVFASEWKEAVKKHTTIDDMLEYLQDTNEDVSAMPEEAARDLIRYALTAWKAATSYESAIQDAISSYNEGDVEQALKYISEAGAYEDEYGAHPGTDAVAFCLGFVQTVDGKWHYLVGIDVTEDANEPKILCRNCSTDEDSGDSVYWGDEWGTNDIVKCVKCGSEIEGLTVRRTE